MKFISTIVAALMAAQHVSNVVAFSTTFTPSSVSSMSAAFGVRSSASASKLQMNVVNGETKPVIKVGVIGMGRIGLVHLEAISKAPGVTPVIVSNPTVSKAEAGERFDY
jgi:threonine dehydrogenase-like Zn-dependent dehydrogenase